MNFIKRYMNLKCQIKKTKGYEWIQEGMPYTMGEVPISQGSLHTARDFATQSNSDAAAGSSSQSLRRDWQKRSMSASVTSHRLATRAGLQGEKKVIHENVWLE